MELFIIIAVIIGLVLLFSMRNNSKKTAEVAQLQLRASNILTIPNAAMVELQDFLVRNQAKLLALKNPKKELVEGIRQVYIEEIGRRPSGPLTTAIVERLIFDAVKQSERAGENSQQQGLMWRWRVLVAIWQLKHDCELKTQADQEFVWNIVTKVNLVTMVMLDFYKQKEKQNKEPWTCNSCKTINSPFSSRCDCGNRH